LRACNILWYLSISNIQRLKFLVGISQLKRILFFVLITQPFSTNVRIQLKQLSMKKKFLVLAFTFPVLASLFLACSKDEPSITPTVVKEWTVSLSPKNESPARPGRTETGTVNIQLMSDNTIKYSITINGLAAGDALTAAHIHAGDVITNGPVVLGFDPVFTNGAAAGTLQDIRTSFIDSLKNDANDLYFNVHSNQQPGGLIRGQLNVAIDMAEDIALVGANEVPPVTTTAAGLAILRVTHDKKLYSKVSVTNLEANDAIVSAHIHPGAPGVNGPVIVELCDKADDFGEAKTTVLTDAIFTTVTTGQIYVNAHSVNHPGGLIRGQVR
jgi:hypothetical protein